MAWRIGLAIFATLAILLVTLFLATSLQMRAALERRDHAFLRAKLRQMQQLYAERGAPGLEQPSVRQFLAAERWLLVRVVSREGETAFLHEPGHPGEFHLDQLGTLRADAKHLAESWSLLSDPRDEDSLEVLTATLSDGAMIQVGRSTDDREDRLEQLRAVFLWSILPVLVLGLLGSVVVSRHFVKPLGRLIETVAEVSRGRIEARVPPYESRGELGRLTRLFNGMLARIESLIGQLRETIDHVAHDIRTPLTSLRGVAESALKDASGEAEYREALVQCVESAEQVLTMVDAILDVSEAEAGGIPLKRQAIGAESLFDEALDLYRAVADEKGIRVEIDLAARPILWVDRVQMRRVLANLLDNALKYTPAGGEIRLRASKAAAWGELTVTDDGEGIDEIDLPRVWTRLYRGDRSRSQRGLGLGLTLVKAIVEAHGGTARIESVSRAGTSVTVRLPLAASTQRDG